VSRSFTLRNVGDQSASVSAWAVTTSIQGGAYAEAPFTVQLSAAEVHVQAQWNNNRGFRGSVGYTN